MQRLFVLIVVFTFLFFSCKKRKSYTFHKVYVNSISTQHWGGGYFKETGYFQINCNDELVNGFCKIDNLTRAGFEWIKKGDSILIKHPEGKCNKIEFVDLKYKKPIK